MSPLIDGAAFSPATRAPPAAIVVRTRAVICSEAFPENSSEINSPSVLYLRIGSEASLGE